MFNTITERVPLTISFHLYFLRIPKVWSMLHHGLVGQVENKECNFMFTDIFVTFFFVVFYKIICVFIIFIYFYKYQFPRQNINQSETRTDDKKLSVELHA